MSLPRRHAILASVALAALLAGSPAAVAQATDTLVEKVESLYNDIYVMRQPNGYYQLAFGARRFRYVESIVNPHDELELPISYTRAMTIGAAYAKSLDSAAMIGLGGGRTSWYLHKTYPQLQIQAAELDPAIVRICSRYFGVKSEPNFTVSVVDGRIFLNKSEAKYDIVLVDAYRGPFVPFHLLTKQFFELTKRRLNEGGVLVQNVEPSTMLFDSAVATMSSVFANLDFYRGEGNIIAVAYDGPKRTDTDIRELATARQAEYKPRYDLVALLATRFQPEVVGGKVLTDDFAPAESLRALERHNQKQPEALR